MNYTLITANRETHARIVVAAMFLSLAVVWFGIVMHG
jgi:hypothetical protein